MPLLLRIGLSYNFLEDENNMLTANLDGVQPNDSREMGAFGLEYSYKKTFFARLGYQLCSQQGFAGRTEELG